MQVSRIEVFGFKSFMDRLVLPLDVGITGIVGPNGCGKSNVVDAIRWVLGESRAKNLRGGVLEDVIFNGTDKLRPLGLAEVTISVRSEGNNFFEDLISPELEAEKIAMGNLVFDDLLIDDEEEEKNNNLDDSSESESPGLKVVNLDIDTEAPQDTEILSSQMTTQDLSVNKTSASTSLLQKYSWLKSASEIQVTRRLYRSGESEFFINKVNCRLKDIKDFFRAIGLSAKGFTIVAQGEVSNIVTSKPEQRRKVMEEAAGVQGFRDKINSAQARLKETSQNLERIEDIVGEVSRQVQSLKRQAVKAKNREELKAEIRQLDEEVYKHTLWNLSSLNSQTGSDYDLSVDKLNDLERVFNEQKLVESNYRASLMEIDLEGDELRARIDDVRNQINEQIKNQSSKTNRLSELGALVETRNNDLVQLRDRLVQIEDRIRMTRQEAGALSSQSQELETRITSIDKEDSLQVANFDEQVKNFLLSLKSKDSEIQKARESYVSLKTELNTLKVQIETGSVREELQKIANTVGASENLKMLLDCIEVDKDYVDAVEAVLAEKAAFLVAKDHISASEKIVSSNQNVSFGIIRSDFLANDISENANFEKLTSKITIQSEFKNALDNILANIYIADTFHQALEYFRVNVNSQTTIVTKKGEILNSSYIAFYANNNGLIKVKSRIKELEELCSIEESRLENLSRAREQVYAELKIAENSFDEAVQEVQRKQITVRELGSELGSLQGRIAAAKNLDNHLQNDLERTINEINRIEKDLSVFQSELVFINSDLSSNDADKENKLKTQLKDLDAEYQIIETKKKEQRDSLNEAVKKLDAFRYELDQYRQNMSEASLARQRVEIELVNLKQKIIEEYGEDYLNYCLSSINENCGLELSVYSEKFETVKKLKARVIREGEIDPESIARYEEENARLEDLEKQRNDLTEASKSLKETLERLTETSIQRFTDTFDKVAENFSILIPKLFGGGVGKLELSDPANPLDSGLEIIARPPGKKLRSIDLMSGGEKALCATALIMSMFLVRPSPLCILDEVDAPLDDANLARFLGIIKEMSNNTQFLVITHNKQSMAVCDNLVGITMEQPGATKAISVSLNEAQEFSDVA